MSKFVLADLHALVPGSGEEHKYLCECIDAIKANKTNVSILNDNLDAIGRVLSRCFDMKITTTILDTTLDNDFTGINIYPEVETARKIVDVACDTPGKDTIIYNGEHYDHPSEVIKKIWQDNENWHIDFDAKLFFSYSQRFTPREIIALLLYAIEQRVFCTESIILAYRSIRHITLNVDQRTANIAKSTRCRNFFMIPIIQSCGYVNFKSENLPESVLNCVPEIGKDYLAALTKIATQFSTGIIDRPSYELKQELTYIMSWVMESINDLKYNMEYLKKVLGRQINAEKSYYVKNILIAILKQFSLGEENSVEESYIVRTPESIKLQEAVLVDRIVKEMNAAADQAEQKLLDKLGRCKQITQEEIDILRLEIEKIQSVDDKMYYMEKVYDKLNVVEYALALIGDHDMKGKVRDSKTKLLKQKEQLLQIREAIIAKKISPERFGLFIKYPAGYEG